MVKHAEQSARSYPTYHQGIKLLKHGFVAIETSSCGELELGGDGKI